MRKRLLATAVLSLSMFAMTPAQADAQSNQPRKMSISRGDTRTPSKGPEANFTGSVSVEPLFPANAPSRVSGAGVTFEPGARSAWHTHPLGQTLIVTAGAGWVQQEGGERQQLRPGDVVWTPPGVKHWHGATSTERLTHLAIQEVLDGKNVEWLEKVTDEQYNAAATTRSGVSTAAPLQIKQPNVGGRRLSPEDVQRVAPALEMYTQEMRKGMLVRISEIGIHANHLEEYKAILKEEAEASVRLEPGVISIFPMYQRDNPTEVRILEIYASRGAYESHIKSPHFQKYKTMTLKMVKSLKLIDMEAMDVETMTEIFGKMKKR